MRCAPGGVMTRLRAACVIEVVSDTTTCARGMRMAFRYQTNGPALATESALAGHRLEAGASSCRFRDSGNSARCRLPA